MCEGEGDGNDKIAAAVGGVQNAMAIRKMKIGGVEGFEIASCDVIDFGGFESVGNVLAVGADILNGGGTGEARNLGEGFDASEIPFAGAGDNGVPIGAAKSIQHVGRVLPSAILPHSLKLAGVPLRTRHPPG